MPKVVLYTDATHAKAVDLRLLASLTPQACMHVTIFLQHAMCLKKEDAECVRFEGEVGETA